MPSFLEGPVLDKRGNLFLVDVAWGRILRVDVHRQFSVVAEYDGEPNGLAFSSTGQLFVADHRRGLLVLDESAGNDVAVVVDKFDGHPFKGLNDLVFGPDGTLYFTDQGATGLHDPTGRLFGLGQDGRIQMILANVPSPNGVAVGLDGTTLFVAATRDNAVWRVPRLADGSATRVGRFVQLSGGTGPDGLFMDARGSLFVAHLGLGVVWVFDQKGVPLCNLDARVGSATTNVVMAPGSSRIFVTESDTGRVLTVDLAEHIPERWSGV
jgi:gluconolactonase